MAATASVLEMATYRTDAEVCAVETQARTIADEARELVICDEKSNGLALDMLSQVRKAVKRIDALKKRWLDPLNEQIKLIRSDFDAMAAPAREADAILARKTSEYRMKVAEEARKEQERLRLLAERRQERAVAKAEERGVEPPPVMPIVPTVAPPAKTVATESGTVTYRKQFHFEITDASAVPREWCIPDEKKIGAAARAEVIGPNNPLPGVRVWVTEEATVR
jgi:hypothetical protein